MHHRAAVIAAATLLCSVFSCHRGDGHHVPQGGNAGQGFVPHWSVGDWWTVGVSPMKLDFAGRQGVDLAIDRPTARYRYEVVGRTVVESCSCYVVEVQPADEELDNVYVNTIYYEVSSLRPVRFNNRTIRWKNLGPAVEAATYNVCQPWMPLFPLLPTDVCATEQLNVTDEDSEQVAGWYFLGRKSVEVYGGLRAVQITKVQSVIDTIAAIGVEMAGFETPGPPYYEVWIAHGVLGERLMRQIWHRDLPWFLFCEDSYFPTIHISSKHAVRRTSGDIDRSDVTKATPYIRAWLLEFGHGLR